ncbi:MAG: hypothetical protein AABZ30_06890, partial [Myxococcota bacterium]
MGPDFPRLLPGRYRVTSPRTTSYNCIAWAMGDTRRWWWPDSLGIYYWPPGWPRDAALGVFLDALGRAGFETT